MKETAIEEELMSPGGYAVSGGSTNEKERSLSGGSLALRLASGEAEQQQVASYSGSLKESGVGHGVLSSPRCRGSGQRYSYSQ
jgi:hypothetical protein